MTERYEYSVDFTPKMYNFISSPENRLFPWGQSSSNKHPIHWKLIERLQKIVDIDPDGLYGAGIPIFDNKAQILCLSVERSADSERDLTTSVFS